MLSTFKRRQLGRCTSAVVAATMLILGLTTSATALPHAAHADTPTYTLTPSSGLPGTTFDLHQGTPCPAPPTDPNYSEQIYASFLSSTDNGASFSEQVDSNGNWYTGYGADLFVPTIMTDYPSYQSFPPDTYTLSVQCTLQYLGTPPSRTVIQTYPSQTVVLTGSAPTVKLSATSVQAGGSITVTPQQSCSPFGPTAQVFAQGLWPAFTRTAVGANGLWGPTTLQIAANATPGTYYVYAACGQFGSGGISEEGSNYAFVGASQAYTPIALTVTGKRYVALGDSVPYGHGLANPNLHSEPGISGTDQGPSSKAYPSLVDKQLIGLAPLALRPTSCDLVGVDGSHYDQLAFSGAPSIDNQWSGLTSCPYPANEKQPQVAAVTPNELNAANLKNNPPGLVTIQAGADDIDFAGCLSAVIGLPSQLGAHNCLTVSGSTFHLTSQASTELTDLSNGLKSIIRTIHTSAPHAQILLVDYYQPLPTGTESLTGTSPLCIDLKAHTSNARAEYRSEGNYVQAQLNGTIRNVAALFPDVKVVELQKIFSGHEVCTSGSSWLFNANWDAVHPTAVGQQHIATAVVNLCASLPKHCLGR